MKHNYNIDDRIKKFDKEIDYISGYEDCKSIVKCYCNRCKNTFERKWCNIARHKDKYRCPICQTKLGLERSKLNNKPTIIPVEERERHFIEQLNDRLPELEYIEGYTWSESYVLLRCKKCNTTFYRCASIIRYPHYKNYKCNECIKIEKRRKKLKEIRLKEIEKARIKLSKATQLYLDIKECKECGDWYIISNNNKTYCSKECRDRACNRSHDRKRINKAKQNGVIDKSITLKKLAKRDNNICYLCNKKVDWNDYKIINDITICGNWYPSIEHVIPLCNGGTHTWENVKLAHRLCNTHKGRQSLIPPGV